MLAWIAKYRLNEYSDVLGLLITIAGFGVTLFILWKSRTVASEALSVARKVRLDLKRVATMAEFSSAISAMEEIKRLHRKKEVESLPERYSQLRRTLIELRAENPLLSDEEKSVLQQAITQFAGFERRVDSCIASGEMEKIDYPKMNRLVSSVMDQTHELVIGLKTRIEDQQ